MTCLRPITPPSSTLSRPRRDQQRLGLRRARRGNGRRARSWSMWRVAWKKRRTSFLGLVDPDAPAFLRPLARLYCNRILKKGVFPKGWKANKAFDPATGPATPAQARVRLEGAHARFDQECRRRAASGQPPVSTG